MLMFTMVRLGWAGLGWAGVARYLDIWPGHSGVWSQGQGATLLVESGLTFAMLISSISTYIRFVMGPGFSGFAFDSLLEDQA